MKSHDKSLPTLKRIYGKFTSTTHQFISLFPINILMTKELKREETVENGKIGYRRKHHKIAKLSNYDQKVKFVKSLQPTKLIYLHNLIATILMIFIWFSTELSPSDMTLFINDGQVELNSLIETSIVSVHSPILMGLYLTILIFYIYIQYFIYLSSRSYNNNFDCRYKFPKPKIYNLFNQHRISCKMIKLNSLTYSPFRCFRLPSKPSMLNLNWVVSPWIVRWTSLLWRTILGGIVLIFFYNKRVGNDQTWLIEFISLFNANLFIFTTFFFSLLIIVMYSMINQDFDWDNVETLPIYILIQLTVIPIECLGILVYYVVVWPYSIWIPLLITLITRFVFKRLMPKRYNLQIEECSLLVSFLCAESLVVFCLLNLYC